jgi:very-short-patch-repair endonuclease
VGDETGIAATARRQHGVVSRDQLLAAGLSSSALDRAVAAGRLERVHQGAFRYPGAPRTWEQCLLAAVLGAGGEAAISHRSAAQLWGIGPDTEVVELSVRRGRLPRTSGAVVHRSLDLDARWTTQHRGIPVTNPLRTLVDLGAVAPAWVVQDALERAVVARLVTVAAVEQARAELAGRGRSGAGVLRRILDDRALGSRPPDSVLEARLASVLRRAQVPEPVFQHEVRHGRRFIARVDFAYPDLRLAIEVDGLDAHGSATALQRDLSRQNALVGAGWTVLRFTWHDAIRRPEAVVEAVRAARRRLLGASSTGIR